MNGEMISFECNGESYQGYLAKSKSGSGPGVILLQEWWGLVGHIKNLADRFAAEGFIVLAPDLYKGEATAEPEEAGKLMMALNIADAEKQMACAVSHLLGNPAVTSQKAGAVGFCMGGQLSLYAASVNSQIGACVDFYGIHPHVHPPLERLQAPVLGVFAERDGYASPEVVEKLDAELTRLGKPHEFHTYDETDHAFFNDARPEVYSQTASDDAWSRTVAFLKENL
jgi:carboxymethylenebutenolidase